MRCVVVGFITWCLFSIASAEDYESIDSSAIDSVLLRAGDNRGQLEEVLRHYTSDEDSLKHRAARFLIAGMGDHSYVTYRLTDTAGNTIPFDAESFSSYDSLLTAFHSLEETHGPLEFERDRRLYDAETITADFLIGNIDLAFRAWREYPWAHFLTFDQFCHFVLPYRGSNEPLEPWRQYFLNRYAWVADSTREPIDAARLVNRDVRSWFGFDRRYYYHPTDQGLAEMLESGLGRCEDMTNVTIYAMRAIGLGVTSDYTPHWGNANNNHAWNAILLPDGKAVSFMGAEADPGEYTLVNRPAKVYRKTFSPQLSNLAFADHPQEKVPRWLGGKNYRDVTADYLDPVDVLVELEAPIPDSVGIAYLCVYNWGRWQAIHWGRLNGKNVTFTAMGPEILYIPALYLDEVIRPWGNPFILHHDGVVSTLEGQEDMPTSMTLTHTTGTRLANSTDVRFLEPIRDGIEYELQFWDHGWKPVANGRAAGQSIIFGNIPGGGLYRLMSPDSDGDQERPFTFQTGSQVWW